jgi:DNA-binding beta-propeller fold protein YncE
MRLRTGILVALALTACGSGQTPVQPGSPVLSPIPPTEGSAAPVSSGLSPVEAAPIGAALPTLLTFKAVPLPGASSPAPLDYLAYEPARARVWVPVGNTGSVDVYDIASGTFATVGGFKTVEKDVRGTKRMMGPSSVAIGEGVAYVGNRADGSVCAVDTATLKLGTCLRLASAPDGVAYVASVKEVWVTTPRDKSIVVLDASKPRALVTRTTIKLDGAPEGYASDLGRGLFFTNLEDANKTVVIDLATHQPKATWSLDCDSKGPRGVAADPDHGLVFVACTDHMAVLDGTRDGVQVARFDTGGGVDNIDWIGPMRLLYAAAGAAARVTVARVDAKGQPTIVATGASVDGVRNVVADASGNAYAADGANARLLVLAYAP